MQVIDSPTSTFEGLRYREISMVSSYNYYKVEILKAKRNTIQSSNPVHPGKKRVNYQPNRYHSMVFYSSTSGGVLCT